MDNLAEMDKFLEKVQSPQIEAGSNRKYEQTNYNTEIETVI